MSDDDEYNSDDPKDVKKRERADKNAANLQIDDLKYLMSLPQFRRFMWHLLTFSKVFEVSSPHAEVRETGFFDGQKNIGLKYFADVQENCPDKYLEMTQEAKTKGNAYDD